MIQPREDVQKATSMDVSKKTFRIYSAAAYATVINFSCDGPKMPNLSLENKVHYQVIENYINTLLNKND